MLGGDRAEQFTEIAIWPTAILKTQEVEYFVKVEMCVKNILF